MLNNFKGGYNMSITIKRNTGWIGYASKIHIKLNGEKVASVMNNQHIDIELPDGKAYLKVTQDGVHSNEIEAKDGDILEIIQTRWYQISFPLFIIVLFLTIVLRNYIPNLKYMLMIQFFVGISILVSLFLIDGFHLKVMTDGINQDS